MTFNEIYKDKEDIFSKVQSVLKENEEQNESFKLFLKMTNLTNKSKEVVVIRNMAIRAILVHILLTIAIPFTIMSIISNFVNIVFIVKFIPTIVMNIILIKHFKKMYSVATQNGFNNCNTDEYKNKDKENDLKAMVSMDKETINNSIKLKESINSLSPFKNFIMKLYLGMTFDKLFEMQVFTTNFHIVNSIIVKYAELLDSIDEFILKTFKTAPEENDFVEFLSKKFNETFIKSIFDNIEYDSKIDNLILLYIFYKKIVVCDDINGEQIKNHFIDYQEAKSDPNKLKNIVTQFISYHVLKYGLEKEEKEKFLR